MKISYDADPVIPVTFDGCGPAQNHWRAIFNEGIVQGGSSGSPLFNQSKRIIGQLHGNQNNSCLPDDNTCHCNQTPIGEYGRFDLSWTGGGTNSTRLSNWLDPAGSNPQTLDGINAPPPSAPTNLTASNITATGCTLSWTRPETGTPTWYWVFIEPGELPVLSSIVSLTKIDITDLQPLTTYNFSVCAIYSDAMTCSNRVQITTLNIPPAISGFDQVCYSTVTYSLPAGITGRLECIQRVPV